MPAAWRGPRLVLLRKVFLQAERGAEGEAKAGARRASVAVAGTRPAFTLTPESALGKALRVRCEAPFACALPPSTERTEGTNDGAAPEGGL